MNKFKKYLSEQDDLSKKGTYVAVKFTEKTNNELAEFARQLGLPDGRPYHCTVAYSKVFFEYPKLQGIKIEIAKIKQYRQFGERGEALVLELDCPFLEILHEKIMKDNPDATYDFETYVPHVTLSYEFESYEIPNRIPHIELEIESIYSEEIKEYEE